MKDDGRGGVLWVLCSFRILKAHVGAGLTSETT